MPQSLQVQASRQPRPPNLCPAAKSPGRGPVFDVLPSAAEALWRDPFEEHAKSTVRSGNRGAGTCHRTDATRRASLPFPATPAGHPVTAERKPESERKHHIWVSGWRLAQQLAALRHRGGLYLWLARPESRTSTPRMTTWIQCPGDAWGSNRGHKCCPFKLPDGRVICQFCRLQV
ncbi:hypothetical protein CC85DRAFT_283850 [Cutaneotrichosporon oleaginosum]|uniref:Uncharacterized protein n=1 Tax=Cutaneotrichosporon oleaginosum TaxID=879819 RepID=A0A0J0XSP7_9TREE|nr:uncharacterized protein CC85DRAFT_283850 [Cutaneotrichosporon oleaginosum]KLT44080.1 hypothetical protein CC85DRAFT_283850 [Cutaneotrichosporon oleaginosum]TXT09464.1 hypothetical protein COLE_03398 [Cutaneotrichosporon oleaginosum]